MGSPGRPERHGVMDRSSVALQTVSVLCFSAGEGSGGRAGGLCPQQANSPDAEAAGSVGGGEEGDGGPTTRRGEEEKKSRKPR